MSLVFKADISALKRAILLQNVNQSALSQKAGVTPATVQRVLKGKPCNVGTANKLSEALRMPVAELFTCD
ncbi:helix-turn-helix domain-containing protein [Veillonella magna]|uniref:helix-turn-helix domain-containing protein n=1 Tax=Veillonella magna TaxID=464322 RepID=UPI0026DB8CD6|nr:helix-turn-helix transcriptional regulator [Veillonella magna]